jgi:hypothetical protein
MSNRIDTTLKVLSLIAVLIFLSGIVVNLGYFRYLESAASFITTSDTFASFTGLQDALKNGVVIVFTGPLVAAMTMAIIYYAQPPPRSRRFVGGGVAALGFLIDVSVRWFDASAAVDTAIFAVGLMILVLGILLMVAEVPRREWPAIAITTSIGFWFLACYQAGISWSFADRDYLRKDFIYMKTEGGQCLKRRILRSLDAGFLVVGARYSVWELWPKGKITYFSADDICKQASSEGKP